MNNITASKTDTLTASNGKEFKIEANGPMNVFGRSAQTSDVEKEPPEITHDKQNETNGKELQSRKAQAAGTAHCQKLTCELLCEDEKKKWIMGQCKSIYIKAVSSKTYSEFCNASDELDEIRENMVALGCKPREKTSIYGGQSALSPKEIETVLQNKFPERKIENKWELFFDNDLTNFILSGEVTAVKNYTEFLRIHTALCIMERKDNLAIKVTFIDSIGIPYHKDKNMYGGYLAAWAEPLFNIAKKHTDRTFELGLLDVASQNDWVHCCAWLAEFLRKTKSYPELTNELWKTSMSIEDSLIGRIYHYRRSNEKPGNLKLYLLPQLPPKYMMAVQNPGKIQRYLENYQGGQNDKLKKVLNREVVQGLEFNNGRVVYTNIHLNRKSLKYSIQVIAKELNCEEGLTDFFRDNSPYRK